jgi:hypothetical protein
MTARARLPKRSRWEREVGQAPGESGGLLDVAAAVGNHAFAAFVQREAATPQRVSDRPHPQLPPGTPAWAQDGEIVLGPPAAVLSPEERADVVHHETIHVLQQRMAPAEETGAARDRAERLADRPRGSLPSPAELQAPAPRLLAAPIKGKATLAGFTRLFAGDGKIVGEVVNGVTVRAELSYQELGIEAPVDPDSKFETKTMTDLQYLACGNRAFPKLEAVGVAMQAVAKQIAAVNGAIPAGSPWRVDLALIVNEASRLHFADGKALLVISQKDFNAAGPETAAHEASHAVFESHSHPDPKKPEALAPDAFALRWADLYLRLAKTPVVALPKEPFKKAKPPLKAGDDGSGHPAGHVMVTDSLWSAGAKTEGHPWEGPDEFFASAFGAFVRDEKLLAQMIAHYAPLDAAVKTGGAELLTLLKAVKDPKAAKGVKPPEAAQQKDATEAIRQRESQASTIKDRLGAILSPETLAPDKVSCPAK